MNDFDFEQLKNLKTPENWIENAINIPSKKNKSLPLWLRPTAISSAAAVVLVVAAVLMTLLFQPQPGKTGMTPSLPVQTTAAATDSADETTQQPTQIVEVTDSYGAVIAAYAVPAPTAAGHGGASSQPDVSSTQPAGATQTALEQQPSVASQPSTQEESTTVPAAIPAKDYATSPATAPATKPLAESTSPCEETFETDAPNAETDKTDVPVWAQETTQQALMQQFTGDVAVNISSGNPLYQSKYITVAFFNSSGRQCGPSQVLKLQTDDQGNRRAVVCPADKGVVLYMGQSYIVRVYNTNGTQERIWLTPSNGNSEIYL